MLSVLKTKLKRLFLSAVRGAIGINAIRSYVERSVFVDDAYMLKFTPHGTFAFFPDETIGRLLRVRGEYSQKLTENVIALLRESSEQKLAPIWLEIGANIGTQTVYAGNTGHFKEFICIEPDPVNFRLLEANLKLNGLQDQTQTHQIGMGSGPAELMLRRSDWNFGGASFRAPDADEPDHVASHFGAQDGNIPVRVEALDDFIAAEHIDVQDIGLVWIDVEGFECEVLKGMSDILKRPIPVLFEYIPERLSAEEITNIRDMISENNKRLYAFGEEHTGRAIDTIDDVLRGCDLLLLPKAARR